MFLVPAIALIAILAAAGPQWRLAVLPILALVFGKAFADRPRHGVCLLLFLTSTPLYLQFHGRDAMVLTTALIAVAYVVAAGRGMLRPVPYVAWPVRILLVLYVVGTAETWATPAWNSSVRMVLGVVAAFMFGHLVYSLVDSQAAAWRMLKVLAAMMIVQAAVAVAQAAHPGHALPLIQVFASRTGTVGPVLTGGVHRATGTIGDYELLSEWFAGSLPVFLALLIFTRESRRLWGAAVAASMVGILATVTRGGVVAGLLGVVVLALLIGARRAEYGMRILAGVCLVVAVALPTFLLAMPGSVSSILARFDLAAATARSGAGMTAVLNRDWNTLPAAALRTTPLGHGIYALDIPGIAWWGSVHSLPLTLWYQVGVVGCLAALGVAFGYAVMYVKAIHARDATPTLVILSSALCAGLVAMAASEFKVEMLRYSHTTQYFAAMLALGLAVFAMTRRSVRTA